MEQIFFPPIPPATQPYPGPMVRIGALTKPAEAAGCICALLREHGATTVRAIGVGATSQATKAIATATRYMSQEDTAILWAITMVEIQCEGESRTAVLWSCRIGALA